MNALANILADYPVVNSRCAKPPYGCGKPVKPDDFTDEPSKTEYNISGLCQSCQNAFFKDPDEYLDNDDDLENWERDQLAGERDY